MQAKPEEFAEADSFSAPGSVEKSSVRGTNRNTDCAVWKPDMEMENKCDFMHLQHLILLHLSCR